jgi:hypothetical protein
MSLAKKLVYNAGGTTNLFIAQINRVENAQDRIGEIIECIESNNVDGIWLEACTAA